MSSGRAGRPMERRLSRRLMDHTCAYRCRRHLLTTPRRANSLCWLSRSPGIASPRSVGPSPDFGRTCLLFDGSDEEAKRAKQGREVCDVCDAEVHGLTVGAP